MSEAAEAAGPRALRDPVGDAPAHAGPVEDLLKGLGPDPERGLPAARVESLRSQFGHNELAEMPPPPLWRKLLGQFNEPLVWILLAAAAVAGLLHGRWSGS